MPERDHERHRRLPWNMGNGISRGKNLEWLILATMSPATIAATIRAALDAMIGDFGV